MSNLTTPQFQPMLSAKFDLDSIGMFEKQLRSLEYPLVASPKLDGIRLCCHFAHGPVTRKLKPLPNHYIRQKLNMAEYSGFDGELIVGSPYKEDGETQDVFNRTTCVMARNGEPNFTYWVFDDFTSPFTKFHERIDYVKRRVHLLHKIGKTFIQQLPHVVLTDATSVLRYEEECLNNGYEGCMLRHAFGNYKYGRSTLKQQGLIKLKRTEDAEAIVVGIEPRMRNDNEQTRDAMGYAKRSTHKDNKTALPMVGRLICRSKLFTEPFGIGSGFDHSLATQWWESQSLILGKEVTFKYQKCGTIDLPRHPIFKALRED